MPVTKSAKRALRGSTRKGIVNKITMSKLEVALRQARKTKKKDMIAKASSFADRAAKTNLIHKNKASRIKSQLSKINPAHTK